MTDGCFHVSAVNILQRLRQYYAFRWMQVMQSGRGREELESIKEHLDALPGDFDLAAAATKMLPNYSPNLPGVFNTNMAEQLETREQALARFFDAALARIHPDIEDEVSSVPLTSDAEQAGHRAIAFSSLAVLMFVMPGAHKFAGFGIELTFGPSLALLLVAASAYYALEFYLKGRIAARARQAAEQKLQEVCSTVQTAIDLLAAAKPTLPGEVADAASRWEAGAKKALLGLGRIKAEGGLHACLKLKLPYVLPVGALLGFGYYSAIGFPTVEKTAGAEDVVAELRAISRGIADQTAGIEGVGLSVEGMRTECSCESEPTDMGGPAAQVSK